MSRSLPVAIRFRTDSALLAELHRRELDGERPRRCSCRDPECHFHPERWREVPPLEPGDCWRIHWKQTVEQEARGDAPVLAGYELGCPRCHRAHAWTTAHNCSTRRPIPGEDGSPIGYTCAHSGTGSCWTWTGDAEAGTLTASPSLHATGACGWHGWLRSGQLVEC